MDDPLKVMLLNQMWFWLSRDIWWCWKHYLVVTIWGTLLTSSGRKTAMLLNVLRCTGQPPAANNAAVKKSYFKVLVNWYTHCLHRSARCLLAPTKEESNLFQVQIIIVRSFVYKRKIVSMEVYGASHWKLGVSYLREWFQSFGSSSPTKFHLT